MRALLRIAKATTVITVAAGLGAGLSLGVSAEKENATGHVYVNDNTAGSNTIGAFDRHSDGSLTPVNGSPFAAGGQGTGTVVGSQGSLQLSSDGRYLLAVDAGSNQISVLRIRRDGSLTPVGNPVWSGGFEPVSIGVHRSLVYVANEGNKLTGTGSNYTGFRLTQGGRLVPLSGSTVELPNTANPGDILFNSTGTNLIGVEVGTTDSATWRIDSFAVGDDGRLTPAPGSPFSAEAAGPFGSEFSPVNPRHLYVSNAHDGKGKGSVSAFKVSSIGTLSSIGGSPYADGQTAPCWVEISHDGRFLFAVNTGNTTISGYRILADGSLSNVSTTAFKTSGSIRPFDARLDSEGDTLYVVDAAANKVSAFAVDGGSLSELAQSPFALPAGATPFGIAVN